MPLPRRLGHCNYNPVIDCEYKPCFNDTVCCSAPRPFRDKYCEEQKIWRQVNCCQPKKKICCPKWDKTEEICRRIGNMPNWNCVQNRNYKENSKTMEALTTCGRRSCLTRDCSGPYYSLKGPVYHPPGFQCQDYSLYIPTKRILEHCKCKGNHSCKKMKRLPGRCFPCTSSCIPIGDVCCNPCLSNDCSMPYNQCQQGPCNEDNIVADIQSYCVQKARNPLCWESQANPPNNCEDTCCQENQEFQDRDNAAGNTPKPNPCPDDCDGAVQCKPPCGMTEMEKLLEEFKHKWNDSPPKSGRRCDRNPILGFNCEPDQTQMLQTEPCNNDPNALKNEDPLLICTKQPDCDCDTCRGQEVRLNGNHYNNCTCDICQKRRGRCCAVTPKITDRKADRCRKLWLDNQREPCHVNPDNSDKTVQNLASLSADATSMECTNSIDCPCPKCCRKRQYARIKPYNCYANGLTNPAIDLKKMYFTGDDNNNASGDKDKGKSGKISKAASGSTYGSSPSPSGSGATTQSGSVNASRKSTPVSDRSNNNIPRQGESNRNQNQDQANKINVEGNQINFEDQDIVNAEYFTGDCKRENPARKSFGLDVTYRQQCCNDYCNDQFNGCNWGCCTNDYNNYYDALCPQDPCQTSGCPCDCPNESSMNNYPHFYAPAPRPRVRRRRREIIPAPTVTDDNCGADDDEEGGNEECEANDYNTTVYRQSFKRIRPRARCARGRQGNVSYDPNRRNCDVDNPDCNGDFPPDDDGWCNGKPRYRRGRTFDSGCQNYLLRSDTFSIFDNMFKSTPSCKKCIEEECQRTCHDKQCRTPKSMELRKIRWPVEDDGIPTCCCECGMLDRYCNTCEQTI